MSPSGVGTVDIGDWLRTHGLAQYEGAFRSNRIDVVVLPMLTAEDLRDLGFVTVGDRRKILDAIDSLRRHGSTMESTETRVGAPERRQITVMFCDLAGSTAISARLDPEDYQ